MCDDDEKTGGEVLGGFFNRSLVPESNSTTLKLAEEESVKRERMICRV